MGTKSDIEIARLLSRQEEEEVRTAAEPAPRAKWRWRRNGWGDWRAQGTDPETEPSAPEPGADAPIED